MYLYGSFIALRMRTGETPSQERLPIQSSEDARQKKDEALQEKTGKLPGGEDFQRDLCTCTFKNSRGGRQKRSMRYTGFLLQERQVAWMGINLRVQDAPRQSIDGAPETMKMCQIEIIGT